LKTGSAALAATAVSWNAKSYAAIAGANDRVCVGVVGCGDRMKQSLIPAFLEHAKELNFEFVAISDLWNRRREEGVAYRPQRRSRGCDRHHRPSRKPRVPDLLACARL
jgi:hypothetical protein